VPSRRETRNRQFLFAQIKNSSKTESPLYLDGFTTASEGRGDPGFGIRPRTFGLCLLIEFIPIKRVSPGQNWDQTHAGKSTGPPPREDPRPKTPLSNMRLLACNPENYVPPDTYALLLPFPEMRHFPDVGVPLVWLNGDIVSSQLPPIELQDLQAPSESKCTDDCQGRVWWRTP
jgi:hypothetical protein